MNTPETTTPQSNTPFMTPQQIAWQRAYAKALISQAIPSGTSGNVTAVSPWGGLAHLAGAGLGGSMLRNAGQNEQASMVNAYASNPTWNYTPQNNQNGPYGYLNYGQSMPGMPNINEWGAALFNQIPGR